MWPKRCSLLPRGEVVLCVMLTRTVRSVPAALQTPSSGSGTVPTASLCQLPSANCTEETTWTGVAVPASCHHINTDWHELTVVWPHPHTYLNRWGWECWHRGISLHLATACVCAHAVLSSTFSYLRCLDSYS